MDRVDTLATVDRVYPRTAVDRIVAISTLDRIVAVLTVDRIPAAVAVNRICSGAAVDPILTTFTVDNISRRAAYKSIVAVSAVQGGGARSQDDEFVVARTAGKCHRNRYPAEDRDLVRA